MVAHLRRPCFLILNRDEKDNSKAQPHLVIPCKGKLVPWRTPFLSVCSLVSDFVATQPNSLQLDLFLLVLIIRAHLSKFRALMNRLICSLVSFSLY